MTKRTRGLRGVMEGHDKVLQDGETVESNT